MLHLQRCKKLTLQNYSHGRYFSTLEHNTDSIIRSRKAPKYWKDVENQKSFFEDAAQLLDVRTKEDWYRVKAQDISKIGGSGLLRYYNSSVFKALTTIYPHYPWNKSKFISLKKQLSNPMLDHLKLREFFERNASKWNIQHLSDWYQITFDKFLRVSGARSVLRAYDRSLYKALSTAFPEFPWDKFRFVKAPGFWNDVSNQKEFVENSMKHLNIKSMENWYDISIRDFDKIGGKSLLSHYNYSLFKLLSTLYPDFPWDAQKFYSGRATQGYWTDLKNQRKFMENCYNLLNLKSMEDWYHVTVDEISQLGGKGVLNQHSYSLQSALKKIFPEFPWDDSKFRRAPTSPSKVEHGYWSNVENQRKFFEQLMNDFKITKPEQILAHVSQEDIFRRGGSGILYHYGNSLKRTVRSLFPETSENVQSTWSFRSNGSKGQARLLRAIQRIFPTKEILVNYKFLSSSGSSQGTVRDLDSRSEIDIFLPEFSLGIEFQGQQHYESSTIFGNVEIQQNRDQIKRDRCKEMGITLIEIPFWWDGTENSLKMFIYSRRPDLIQISEKFQSIPSSNPKPSVSRVWLNLPSTLENLVPSSDLRKIDFKNWWISVKSHGLPIFWDGKVLFQRENRKRIPVPKFFVENFPPTPFEGALVYKNSENSEKILQILRYKRESEWKQVECLVTDDPVSGLEFERRFENLSSVIPRDSQGLKLSPIFRGQNYLQILEFFYKVIGEGSSGLVVRKPQSMYSDLASIFEILPHQESKALVRSYDPKTGVATCLTLRGTEFSVKFSQILLKQGKVVTIRYPRVSVNKTPINPQISQVDGIPWESICHSRSKGYLVTNGVSTTTRSACKTCGNVFTKTEPRIQLKINFHPNGFKKSTTHILATCVNEQCFNTTLHKYQHQETLVFPFRQEIFVDPQIDVQRLPNMEGIKFVNLAEM